MTIEPGDGIATGTPSGVAHARKPPAWMKAGDKVEVEVEKIGVLANPIVDEAWRGGTSTRHPGSRRTCGGCPGSSGKGCDFRLGPGQSLTRLPG